jgi:pSer/pThr/pTyr-binding forkhead associated (FHA) protein
MQFCRTCGSDIVALARAAAQAPAVTAPVPPPMPHAQGSAPHAHGAAPLPSLAPPYAPGAQAFAQPPRAPLPAHGSACPGCGAGTEPGTRFCKFCGTPIESGAASAPLAPLAPLAPAAVAATQQLRGQVVVIQRDGSEGRAYPLEGPQTDVGSREGDILLPEDPYLSPRHARIERRSDAFVLVDLGSTNGVYLRLREPVELTDGTMFLIGQQVLRFQVLPEAERRVGPAKQQGVMLFGTPEMPRLARIAQYTTEGLERDVYYLYRDETVFGREQADIVFPEDPFVSRRHAAITMDRERMRFALRDLGSSNGTSIRCYGERPLAHGDQFRLGRHLFRFDLTAAGHGPGHGGRAH